MLPIQDAVPTGRTPRVTLALVVINVVTFVLPSHISVGEVGGAIDITLAIAVAPFAQAGTLQLCINLLFLWIFGDTVEHRLGRTWLLLLYVGCGVMTATASALWALDADRVGVAAAAALGGVLGAYIAQLPQSKILMLVPLPLSLAEVPATLLLLVWAALQIVTFVIATGTRAAGGQAMWSLAAAFSVGAAVGWTQRRPWEWARQ